MAFDQVVEYRVPGIELEAGISGEIECQLVESRRETEYQSKRVEVLTPGSVCRYSAARAQGKSQWLPE